MNFLKLFMTAVLTLLSVTRPAFAVGASYSQSDVTNLNNAEPPSKYNRSFGYRHGGGRCVFDPSATSASRTIAAHGCGLIVPKNAIVTFAAYDVITTFTSATDAATIAVKIVSANDVVSAVAISNGANAWDAGLFETIPKVETSSTWLTTTADSEVTFTVAVEALTAGKLVLWVDWMYFGDL